MTRHASQRPLQFTRRPPSVTANRVDDCEWGDRRLSPCGACDRCQYEEAVYRADHPASLSVEELAHL